MIGLPGEGESKADPRPIRRSPCFAEELEFLSIKVPDGPLTSKLQLIQPGDRSDGRKTTGNPGSTR